jgi:predicted  nucleic acid-binding Zn-ribbon protein
MTEPQALLRLQEIDLDLLRCERALQTLPQRERLATVKVAQRRMASEITKIVGRRKDVEIDLADLDEKRKHYEGIVGEVQAKAADSTGDFRALHDFEGQLSELAKALEKTEFETGKNMEELERVEHAEKNARDVQTRLGEQEAALVESFRKDAATVLAERKQLEAERADVTPRISAALLKRYAAACERFDGNGVETLVGNKPTACRVTIQPSQYTDLRHGGPITECPWCHRILVIQNEQE